MCKKSMRRRRSPAKHRIIRTSMWTP
jgi:hypothetical protein